jgi:hypothetical protein
MGFELDNSTALLRSCRLARILEGILHEFKNYMTSAIVDSSQWFQFAPKIDISGITQAHTIERKIGFRICLLGYDFVEYTTRPVSTNRCSSTADLAPLGGLQPLSFVDFVVHDCDLLMRAYEAPEEIIE